MFGGLVTHTLYRLDVALVALWRSPAEAGLYIVALAVTEVLWVLPNSAAQAIVPRSTSVTSTLDVSRVSRVLVALMAAGGLVIIVAAPAIIPLVFGHSFDGATAAVPFLVVAAIAVGLWKLFSFNLLAQGDPRSRLVTGVAGLVVMVAMDALVIPRLGIAGAAAGSFVAYTAAAALCVGAWRRANGVPVRRILLVERGDVRALLVRGRSSRSMTASSVDPTPPAASA
jgi:O-antigen/teichoic acid export membrane protein